MLIQQLAEANTLGASEVALTSSVPKEEERGGGDGESERVQGLESKVKLLEKDLFYYKKTSRELKKRLQQFQSQASGGGHDAGSSVTKLKGRRREEGGGGGEGKSKSARGSSTERGCHDVIMSRDDGVTDSLEVRSVAAEDKGLSVSGTSLIAAGTKGQQRSTTTTASSSSATDRVERAPPIAPPTGEAQQQQVVRKQKKQLRLLR